MRTYGLLYRKAQIVLKGGETVNETKTSRKLIELRGKRKREDVAKAVGISVSALAMYEQGERVPRDDIKVKLANYYKRSVGSIFFID